MNFIERCLGISPDGGDGSFEVFLVAVAVTGVLLFFCRRAIATRLRRSLGGPGKS